MIIIKSFGKIISCNEKHVNLYFYSGNFKPNCIFINGKLNKIIIGHEAEIEGEGLISLNFLCYNNFFYKIKINGNLKWNTCRINRCIGGEVIYNKEKYIIKKNKVMKEIDWQISDIIE